MKKALLLLVLLLLLPIVFADDITFTLNQTEYYFLVGEQANINLKTDNSYAKPIPGTFTYTITQEINQGNFQYSSSNTQSKSYTVPDGKQDMAIGFGTSNQPVTLKVNLDFSYHEKDDRVVNLDEILIHFVSDESQKQNKQQQTSSSSTTQEQQSQQEQQSLSQQMQQQINQMFNQQQPGQPSVQNNQMPTDSSALKDQMEKELQEKQKTNDEFQKNLAANEDFRKAHQQLMQQGYNLSSANVDAQTNNTGSFELNYSKDGQTATLKGNLNNGTMENLEKSSSQDLKDALQTLQQNKQYQKYDQQLKNDNFKPQEPQISKTENKTQVQIQYQNDKNETATIKATLKDDKVEQVKLERSRDYAWIWLLVILVLILATLLVYRKYHRKQVIPQELPPLKPIDIKKEALKILDAAKKLFEEKKFKDAYGKAAEAIRFYYSHKLELKKELTNSDLIKNLKTKKIKFDKTQKCLNLCQLVEFAKYTANKKDFDEIVELAKDVIV